MDHVPVDSLSLSKVNISLPIETLRGWHRIPEEGSVQTNQQDEGYVRGTDEGKWNHQETAEWDQELSRQGKHYQSKVDSVWSDLCLN